MTKKETIVLNASLREEQGKKVKALRRQGQIPAVVYGHGLKPQSLKVSALDFGRVFQKAGENTLVELSIDGGKAANVIIADIQQDPITNRFTHADFFQVRMDEKIEAAIPLEFQGEAPAVKELGGIFLRTVEAVEVECLPADLPHSIEVDITILKTFDDHIKLSDLKVPTKVKILGEPEMIIASVERPRTEEELAALNEKVEMDVTQVEGVVKETPAVEGEEGAKEAKKEEKKGE